MSNVKGKTRIERFIRLFENYDFNKIGNANKGTTLIVGDSLSSDIQGGINYGISTCWYNPIGEENKTGLEPEYEIKDLRELFKLL